MNQAIRWGILGTGIIARQFAEALRHVPDAQLQAVASRTQDTALAFGRDFDVPTCHGNYAALAADPEVDVIYIATPHPLHADNARLCLQAGKPVLCEKPFTMHAEQARSVVALAREKELFLMEAMWSRFLPGIVEAKRLIDSGIIGRAQHVQADFGYYSGVGPEHRLLDPALGGGALLDLGIYPLSMAAYFLGPVASAHAIAEIGLTGVDEQTAFTLRHAGGGLSSCFCSFRVTTPRELVISGPLGSVRIARPFSEARHITIDVTGAEERHLTMPLLGNGYAHEAIEVGRCLRAGLRESPVMPLDQTVALLDSLDQMRSQIGLRYPADGA
ncbi:Gfo/Idh/MocA family oxidoreductase [Actimicrobium sp. CCC2.4]|uniref:Gfo/Idh/MocA family protein n=1 Tax=Actimicrobium sp. CCC2.4 TaxID=3048606 RepID=UPI002AC973D2|nr:Gfo/Idh/MocA family oxidoreductase [Actimicrobium sp. CCC2.4]MEB0137230.1 Gfo/Idh/MocA family oxidoreductase [Actimicrobium sp. CCC2.4]WPX33503.1 Gfo/Idh/MocA family oxidoreductase [Actimicrobium sp. CCC2.4]